MCTETECTKCLYRLHVRTLHKGTHAHQQDPNDSCAQRGREGGPVAQRTLPAQRGVSLAFMLEYLLLSTKDMAYVVCGACVCVWCGVCVCVVCVCV